MKDCKRESVGIVRGRLIRGGEAIAIFCEI